MNNEPHRAPAQVVVGLLVVALGFLFLLDNLGVFAFRHAIALWPLALVLGGASLIVSDETRGARKIGTALVVVGLVLTVQRLGLFDISWRIVWPLLMIGVGGYTIFRTMSARQRVQAHANLDGATADNFIDATAIMGGVERRVATADFRGADITALMGGCELDLRACSMAKEAVIDVFAFWGGVTIKVPVDWTVVVQGIPIMGGFAQKTAAAPDAGKRLLVKGCAVMGGIEVRN